MSLHPIQDTLVVGHDNVPSTAFVLHGLDSLVPIRMTGVHGREDDELVRIETAHITLLDVAALLGLRDRVS